MITALGNLDVHYKLPVQVEDKLKQEIIHIAKVYTAEPGDIIMDLGLQIETIPLVLSGSIKILREDRDGHEIFLYYLEQGDACATSITCRISEQKSTIRAIAEDDTKYLAIPVRYSDIWFNKYPSWKSFVMNTYAHRFEELLKAVDQLAFKKMDQRLSKYLLDKADLHENKEIKISHQEIAYDLNTSREVISRLLKQLEKIGDIQLGRNRITLLDDAKSVSHGT